MNYLVPSNVLGRLWPEDESFQFWNTEAEHPCSSPENKIYGSKLMRNNFLLGVLKKVMTESYIFF